MSFKELYEFAQHLQIPVGRNDLINKVCELTNKPKPRCCKEAMDTNRIRGYFVTPGIVSNERLQVLSDGKPLIVVARDLNYCWERFVIIKELMHYFDTPLEQVSSADEFNSLLDSFTASAPSLDRSEAFNSEITGFWMALGVLCPETKRQELLRSHEQSDLPFIEIARLLRIPEQYVPHLFTPNYKNIIARLLD